MEEYFELLGGLEPWQATPSPADARVVVHETSGDESSPESRSTNSRRKKRPAPVKPPPSDAYDMPSRACNNKLVDIEDIFKNWAKLVSEKDWGTFEEIVLTLAESNIQTEQEFIKAVTHFRRKYRISLKKSQLLYVFNSLVESGKLSKDSTLRKFLVKKSAKSTGGVLVITVLTSPWPATNGRVQEFSCEWNCYYYPNEPAHKGNNDTPQPRSYLHDEPSVLRANRNNFDPVMQFYDRAITLAMNGHPVDKIELLILGGTWSSYPRDYQEGFIRDLFYAANTFTFRANRRAPLSLDEEKRLNESAACKIIGITLETRPDCVNFEELKYLRRFGCTRVQLGIQHTDNTILKKINRGCTTEDAIRAIRLLKDNCFKIDIHLMPNLPGSSAEKDIEMFNHILTSEWLQADQWKIYPCEVTPWTTIKKWFHAGKFVPYPDQELIDVLLDVKSKVHPWIRLNRVIRDIPSQYIMGGINAPSLRQQLGKILEDRGTPCRCIRCREIKGRDFTEHRLFIKQYAASGGTEYFISFENADATTLFGFVRLRLAPNQCEDVFPELQGAALIRELHVYGQLIPTSERGSHHTQNIGLGTKLMIEAEKLAVSHGYTHIAVIAGVGVRNYYRRFGYILMGEGEFMIKKLRKRKATTLTKPPLSISFVYFAFGVLLVALLMSLRQILRS